MNGKKKTKQSCQVQKHTKQKTTTHKTQVGKGPPKYDSKSETTIDSLPLIENHTRAKTHRNRKHRTQKHRMLTPTHSLTKPK